MRSIRSRIIGGILLISYVSLYSNPSFADDDGPGFFTTSLKLVRGIANGLYSEDGKPEDPPDYFNKTLNAILYVPKVVVVATAGIGLNACLHLMGYREILRRIDQMEVAMTPISEELFWDSLSYEQKTHLVIKGREMVKKWPKAVQTKFNADTEDDRKNSALFEDEKDVQ